MGRTQRLLFLKYGLPYQAYPYIGLARRSRFRRHQHFKTIRLRYMITGSPSALEELQSLRDFGRVISRTDDPSFLLHWSDDGQVYGFSFIQNPQNRLTDAYLELFNKACTTRRGYLVKDGRWDWGAIYQYKKQADTLTEMLAGGLHTACGQLPRASKLLGLEYMNGLSTGRGIYVWNRFLIYIIRHYKAKRLTNREFNIACFLPVQLGHSIYKSLVYIRPFLDML
ncbi:hypothetical protein B0O99DRAFT_656577 [Bisporella sp. PMI_857]|nr:hypothetical protein B0O99DRAFT_656577 [Bisporella sp. PMI_857]